MRGDDSQIISRKMEIKEDFKDHPIYAAGEIEKELGLYMTVSNLKIQNRVIRLYQIPYWRRGAPFSRPGKSLTDYLQ